MTLGLIVGLALARFIPLMPGDLPSLKPQVDISNIEADRRNLHEAFLRWQQTSKKVGDANTMRAVDDIGRIAAKNYRKALTLLGLCHATLAENSQGDSSSRRSNNHIARHSWLKAASLGEYKAMDFLSWHYGYSEPTSEVDAAVWAVIKVRFAPATEENLAEAASARLSKLNPATQQMARDRASALIAEIEKNRNDYESIVRQDLEYMPK